MVQTGRTTADVTDGGWTDQEGSTTLYAAIDEAAADTADYVQSSANPSGDTFRVKMCPWPRPASQ
jgi:hypothetical protein